MAKILVVDDDPQIRTLLKRLLTLHGHAVETADDGDQGINRLQLAVYDLLIIDETMPKISGTQAVGIVRSHSRFKDLRILMLTGVSVTATVDAAYGAGVDAFVVKPFAPERFMAKINGLLGRLVDEGFLVLIVDDEAPVRRALARQLGERRISTCEAADGREAMELARVARPDLILLDLGLPGVSGQDVLSALKRDERTRTLPIVILTGQHEANDWLGAVENGADDYATKPCDFDDLARRIKRLVERHRGQRQAK